MKRLGWAFLIILALMPPPAIAQSPAAGGSSPATVDSTASCRRSAESWDGAYDFVRQLLTTIDISAVRPTELILLNKRIASAMRVALGGSDTVLPRADTLGRPEADGALPFTIVMHRDAPATWRVDAAADSAGARLANLYTLVLGAMAPSDLRIPWPSGAPWDSAEIRVRLITQVFGPLNAQQPSDNSLLIFRALHPIDPNGPPVVARAGQFFPSYHVMNGVAWRVVMEATIDADGNVEKKTVHDIRSMASASDSAHFDYSYQKIVDAAREAVLHSKYVPAHHGGCAVEQVVRQSFVVNPGALR